jgi:hypothetical protein
MVRIYSAEREDGLVEWRVPGKRRPTRTIRLDVTRSENGVHERKLGPKGEHKGDKGAAGTVRRRGRAGERREGSAAPAPIEQAAPEVNPG